MTLNPPLPVYSCAGSGRRGQLFGQGGGDKPWMVDPGASGNLAEGNTGHPGSQSGPDHHHSLSPQGGEPNRLVQIPCRGAYQPGHNPSSGEGDVLWRGQC